jgi:hypothetical protein
MWYTFSMKHSRILVGALMAAFLLVPLIRVDAATTTVPPQSCNLKVGAPNAPQATIKYTTDIMTVTGTSITTTQSNGGFIYNMSAPTPATQLTLYWSLNGVPKGDQLLYQGTVPTEGTTTSFFGSGAISGLTPNSSYVLKVKDQPSASECVLGSVVTPATTPSPSPSPSNPSQTPPQGNGFGEGQVNGVGTGNGFGEGTTPLPVENQPLLQDPLNGQYSSIPKIFVAFIDKLVIPLAIPFVALAIIYTGFMFVVARGNQEKLKKAKEAFKWTIIGATIVLGAYVIASVVESTIDEIRPPTNNTSSISSSSHLS